MEQEVIKKMENQFPLGSNKDLLKTKKIDHEMYRIVKEWQ